jgi:RecG-like helicase
MIKTYIAFFTIICSLLLTSCFELREEIDLNKDGSGTYRLLLDMSQSKQTLDLAQKMQEAKDNEAAKNLNFTIDSTFAKSVMRFKNMPGISFAKDTVNKTDYVFGIIFNFSGMEALNNAIMELNKDENGKLTIEKPVYSMTKNIFERQNLYYFNNISEVLKVNTNVEKNEKISSLLQGASYVSVIKVNGKIKKYSNKKAEIDYTKTVLRLATPLPEAISGKSELGNVIKIK